MATKTYDKPQHIRVVDVHEFQVQRLDRAAFRKALAAAGVTLPKLVAEALERGRFDEDVLPLHSALATEPRAHPVLRRLLAGEMQTTITKREESVRWEWVDPTDARVDPDVRNRALAERAAKSATPERV